MAFFQNSVLNRYLETQDQAMIQDAYQRYVRYFHDPAIQQNIRNAKEEQFQEGFIRELFVYILGYTLNPNPDYNLTTELKNEKGSQKADGAILKDGKALAVIELKGTDTTDLDKINAQAFNYKNNHSNCVYVITSNFEKLRFFIHNSVHHLEFSLFHLTKEQFRLLWLCLHADNLLKGIALKVKEESLLVDEKITHQLYKDYASFRTDLWHNMVKNNPAMDRLLLFKKTQKLIDRFLFVFFAEDSGLLPPNSILRVLQRYQVLQEEDAYKSLYVLFSQYFGYINKGRPGKTPADDIFAYNGGLFLPDEVLDQVMIDDDVLHRHVNVLTRYNFQSEVDVNILGHIFENSLNEIESITAELEGKEIDRSKTKRKKDGVFYTPKYITKYIVDQTVGKLCEEKKAELGIVDEEFAKGKKNRKKETVKKLEEQLKAYRNWLLGLTICDPACGSGAFLNQALEFLMEEHAYIDELQTKLFGLSIVFQDVSNHILENNLFGVDINEESVEIAKLSLWLRTAKRGRKLSSLNHNIQCGNSLIDDPEVAGDKAFDWQERFPNVFAKGGFDVVIGNPPYVNIVNIEDKILRKHYQTSFSTFKNKCDLYSLFIERSIELAKAKGKLGFIFPNSWMGTSSFSKFREKISKDVTPEALVELPPGVFSEAVVTTVIMIFTKVLPAETHKVLLVESKNQMFYFKKNSINLKDIIATTNYSYSMEPKIIVRNVATKIGDCVKFSLGIKTSDDKRFIFDYRKDKNYYPILRGKDIGRYFKRYNGEYIWYMPELIKEKVGGRPRVLEHFMKPKILIQDIAKTINCTYDDENFLVNDTVNVIHEVQPPYSLHSLIAILNSKLCSKWFKNNFPEGLHIKINQLQEVPLPKIQQEEEQYLSGRCKLILNLKGEFGKVLMSFAELIASKYHVISTKKLQNWPGLDSTGFLAELKKAKIKLSLSEEAQWMAYFNEQKQKAMDIQHQIERTDREIDQLVYTLYGLSEEEIKVIEE